MLPLKLRDATPADLDTCMVIRGQTRDNPISRDVLAQYGVTPQSWTPLILDRSIIGKVFENKDQIVAFTFADTGTGEILVIAILPEFESQGLGKKLLTAMVAELKFLGHKKLWLAAAPDPSMRAYGFYRHLGWTSTGKLDEHGDEILELSLA